MYKYEIEYQRSDQESVKTLQFSSENEGYYDSEGFAFTVDDCFSIRLNHLIAVFVKVVDAPAPVLTWSNDLGVAGHLLGPGHSLADADGEAFPRPSE